MTYQELLQKIDSDEPFSFARYGDGEWACLLGHLGTNCDGHEYFPSLGRALKSILESQPDYYLGMQSLAKRTFTGHPEFDRLVQMNDWVEADIIHRENEKNGLQSLFDVLKTKEVTLVGHNGLRAMDKYFPIKNFIEVPKVNAWLEKLDIEDELLETKEDIILYCSGMMSNVLIDDLTYSYMAYGSKLTQIDIGSAFQPYINEPSRNYHYKMKI